MYLFYNNVVLCFRSLIFLTHCVLNFFLSHLAVSIFITWPPINHQVLIANLRKTNSNGTIRNKVTANGILSTDFNIPIFKIYKGLNYSEIVNNSSRP